MSVALAWVPKPLCIVSFLSSYVVIREVLHPDQNQRNQTLRGCLFNLAVADCIGSLALFFTTWAMPSDVPGYFQNIGSQATCTVQGFFIEIGYMAAPLFSFNLSVLFLMLVRYNMTEASLLKYQRRAQVAIWSSAITFAIVCLGLGFYNPVQGFCWVAPYPFDCLIREDGVCLRGENAQMAVLTHVGLAFTTPLCGQIFLFGWLFRTVYNMETPVRRSSISSMLFSLPRLSTTRNSVASRASGVTSGSRQGAITSTRAPVNRKRSQAVAVRSMLYIGGYLMTFFPSFIDLIFLYFKESEALATWGVSFLATQGIWTLMVFMRNRTMLTPEGRFVKLTLLGFIYNRGGEQEKRSNVAASANTLSTSRNSDHRKRQSMDDVDMLTSEEVGGGRIVEDEDPSKNPTTRSDALVDEQHESDRELVSGSDAVRGACLVVAAREHPGEDDAGQHHEEMGEEEVDVYNLEDDDEIPSA